MMNSPSRVGIVQASENAAWAHPAGSRKQAMVQKLEKVKAPVAAGDYAGTYDKFLHDIKLKLISLKTDENEAPWGDGVFPESWVVDNQLQDEFRLRADAILHGIFYLLNLKNFV